MATCSFIKERKQTAGSMGRVIQYVSQPKKTMDEEGNRYLTGVNCVADVAMQSFMATKHLYGKDTGTFFYQYIQSFSPEEDLTPAQAHQIGLKLAEQFCPGGHACGQAAPPLPLPSGGQLGSSGYRKEAPLHSQNAGRDAEG